LTLAGRVEPTHTHIVVMTGRHGHHRRAQSMGIASSSGLTSDFASDRKLVIQIMQMLQMKKQSVSVQRLYTDEGSTVVKFK